MGVFGNITALAGLVQGASNIVAIFAAGVWRPPQWANSAVPQPLTMTANDPQTNQSTIYVFDVIIRIEHELNVEITKNPVQTGAAITDNAYLVPPHMVAEIRMSDAMQSFTLGQWANSPSKSVSAYQTLVAIASALSPVQLSTRLRPYSNMLITNVRAEDDKTTAFGLRAWITFSQVLTASVAITQVSSSANPNQNSEIPQTTGGNNSGQIQTIPPTAAMQAQNNVASTAVQ